MKKFFTYLLAAPVVLAMAFATGCQDPKPDVPVGPVDPEEPTLPTITVTEDIDAQTYNSAAVIVKVSHADKFKYAYYIQDARPEDAAIEWKEVAVEKDGDYRVVFEDLPTSLTGNTKYTFEAFASMKDTLSEAETINFQTLVAQHVMVEDLAVSARQISFVAELLKAHCQAFCYIIMPKTDYDLDAFKKDIEEGWAEIIKESAVIIQEPLEPEKEYVIAIVPINLTEDGKFKEYAGSVIVKEVKTIKYGMGQKEVVATLAIDEASVTFVGANATITRPDTLSISGYYFGAVKKSDLGDATVGQWLNSSDWLYANQPQNYNYYQRFDKGKLSADFRCKLEPETEYEVFVIAVDKDGFIGKATSVAVKTPPIVFNPDLTVTVHHSEFNKDEHCVDFTLGLSDNCTKVYRLFYMDGNADHDETRTLLIEKAMNPIDEDFWSAQNVQESNVKLRGDLNPGNKYELFMLPVGADGSLGEMIVHEFEIIDPSAVEITFDPSITMDFEIAADPVHSATKNFTWEYVITPTLDASAGSCEYGVVYLDYGFDPATEGVEAAAKSLYKEEGSIKPSVPDVPIELANWTADDREAYIVYIPIGVDGTTKGQPVMKKVMVAPGHRN